jgi:predicted  nucleic acid-binding Zn-ribbon protein
VSPELAFLVAVQQLDTAADRSRRRLAELPAAEHAIDARISEAAAAVEAVKHKLQENQHARRALDKDVAAVDTRLARFEDHKAAVKTNQEYTALLHEIATAKGEKDAVEDRILELMEAADGLAAELRRAEAGLVDARRDGETQHATLGAERATLEKELARLADERRRETAGASAPVLAKYEQILKNRRGIAVVAMVGDICSACHVRLRPHIAQQIRRNEDIVSCESCQRILYFVPPEEQAQSPRPT